MRSREQKVEFEARPSKLFAAFERENSAQKNITEVKHPAGVARSNAEVARAFAEYYAELFSRRSVLDAIPAEVLNQIPKIPEETKDLINTPITEAEIERTIKSLPRNKSHGPDGIISEFYMAFRKELSPILAMVFKEIRKQKRLPSSMRTSHLALIPKKVPTDSIPDVADYRPISLLSTDYKILARVLAGWLESALSAVVGPHQTCGFKGRSINSNLHRMRVAVEAAESGLLPLAIVQLDLRKAFDQVDHNFLLDLLQHCGIGDTMIDWITTCYEDISTCVVTNRSVGTPIDIHRSVRQGCPMSPILFTLYLEPLCRMALASEVINGLKMGDEELRVLAYADDVAFICTRGSQVGEVIKLANQFCLFSGAELNLLKSRGAMVG